MLGGTTEASRLALDLAAEGRNAIFSYAGRTGNPVVQPLPTRVGGFGGVQGLVAYLRAKNITHVVDATHAFAAGISANAVAACAQIGIPLVALERPPWTAGNGDSWVHVSDLEGAVAALPDAPARVFLAIGKQHIGVFATKPQHHYLLRLVDAPKGVLPLPNTSVIIARGPFDVTGDRALLEDHKITHIVAKNSGGAGAVAKLQAARALSLPVIMIDRPTVPPRRVVDSTSAVLDWLDHNADLGE